MRRLMGFLTAGAGLLLLVALLVWSGFLIWVYTQGLGNDQEAVLIMQPITCLCMVPVALLVVAGIGLALMPARD